MVATGESIASWSFAGASRATLPRSRTPMDAYSYIQYNDS
jgi:hypothetical protein